MLSPEKGSSSFDRDEEEAGLLIDGANGRKSESSDVPEIPFCGCLSINYYKPVLNNYDKK
jgi:hypothetical protein